MSRTPQVEKQEVGRTWQISCTSASARRDSEDEDGWMGRDKETGNIPDIRSSAFVHQRPSSLSLSTSTSTWTSPKSQEPHRDGIGLLVMPNLHLQESFAI